MKKKWMLAALAAMMSVSAAVPAMAGHIYAGVGVDKAVSRNADGGRVITLTFDPEKMPEEFRQECGITTRMQDSVAKNSLVINSTAKTTPARLTAPPQIGATLGNIYNEETQKFTENYRHATIGECVWYVEGRVKELYGVELPFLGEPKEWIANAQQTDSLEVIADLTDVPEQAVAVFAPTEDAQPGHVMLIEYVTRDAGGKPIDVYYTDANGANDPNKGQYDAGFDGAVQCRSFEEFKNRRGLRLLGFIKPKE